MTYFLRVFLAAAVLVAAAGCARKPPVAEAKAFLDAAEAKLLTLSEEAGRAAWVQATYITDDTEMLAARANQRLIDAVVELVKGVQALRRREASRRTRAQDEAAQALAHPGRSRRSQGERGTHAHRPPRMEGAYGKGRACPRRREGPSKCLDINAVTKVMAESRNPAELLERVARLARGRRAAEEGLPAVRRTLQQGRPRDRLRRHGRDVALQVRHAARRVRQGSGPALGAGEAAVRLAARLRAQPPAREVRRYRGAGERADSRAPAGQHVGAVLGEHLSAGRAAERRSGLRPDRDPQEPEDRRAGNGALRRALLHLARLRAAAADVLGAVAVHQAARPRGGLPRQRLGRGQRRTTCASRCASSPRRRTSSPSTTSWATTSTSAPTTSSPCCSATAPTTASTKRWATPSRCR